MDNDFSGAVKDYIALHHAENASEILNEVPLDRHRMKHFSFHCQLRGVDPILTLKWIKSTIK